MGDGVQDQQSVRDQQRKKAGAGKGADGARPNGKYAAALLSLAVVVPPVAATISIAIYIVSWPAHTTWPNDLAVPIGIAGTLTLWLVGAFLLKGACTAQRVDPNTYGTLADRLESLEAQAGLAPPTPPAPEVPPASSPPVPEAPLAPVPNATITPPTQETSMTLPPEDGTVTAKRELERYSTSVRSALATPGMPWVLATGYVQTWILLHSMEEALIEVEPCDALLRDALFDEARLTGSSIDNRDDLLDQLRLAVQQLGPDAAVYLAKQASLRAPGAAPPTAPSAAPPTAPSAMPPALPPAPAPLPGGDDAGVNPRNGQDTRCEGEVLARSVLRTVRHAINEYRDTRRGGLVRARNQLMATMIVTGITVYLLLGLAMILHAPVSAIVGSAAFFLVGASVGLFNRLSSQSTNDNAVDDFGLSVARLTFTPTFSGLAAVGGVLLTAMLFSTVLTTSHPTVASQSLDTIYSLAAFPFNIVIAAVFGLTPGLFLSGLQQQSDKFKADLKSSQASSRG